MPVPSKQTRHFPGLGLVAVMFIPQMLCIDGEMNLYHSTMFHAFILYILILYTILSSTFFHTHRVHFAYINLHISFEKNVCCSHLCASWSNWINTSGLVGLVVTGMPTNWCTASHFMNRKKIWRHVNTSTFLIYFTSSTFSVKVTVTNLSLFLSETPHYRSNKSLPLCCHCLFKLNQAAPA